MPPTKNSGSDLTLVRPSLLVAAGFAPFLWGSRRLVSGSPASSLSAFFLLVTRHSLQSNPPKNRLVRQRKRSFQLVPIRLQRSHATRQPHSSCASRCHTATPPFPSRSPCHPQPCPAHHQIPRFSRNGRNAVDRHLVMACHPLLHAERIAPPRTDKPCLFAIAAGFL